MDPVKIGDENCDGNAVRRMMATTMPRQVSGFAGRRNVVIQLIACREIPVPSIRTKTQRHVVDAVHIAAVVRIKVSAIDKVVVMSDWRGREAAWLMEPPNCVTGGARKEILNSWSSM